MIGIDIDGTLLDYSYKTVPSVNLKLIKELVGLCEWDDYCVLISNQGGLNFGLENKLRADGRKYPSPVEFSTRLNSLLTHTRRERLRIARIYISLYHPNATAYQILNCYQSCLQNTEKMQIVRFFLGQEWRKPNTGMFEFAQSTGTTIDCYYGDSDEDEEAARNFGIKFVRVERFG